MRLFASTTESWFVEAEGTVTAERSGISLQRVAILQDVPMSALFVLCDIVAEKAACSALELLYVGQFDFSLIVFSVAVGDGRVFYYRPGKCGRDGAGLPQH